MKYVCKICGYIYDEEQTNVAFNDLPDNWACPLCAARKEDFQPLEDKTLDNKKTRSTSIHKLEELSFGELSAVFSNLAKGCEKQYMFEEQKNYQVLADYFATLVEPVNNASVQQLTKKITKNLEEDYADVHDIASSHQDRGTLRVCVWGEKVTRILNSLLARYEKEGEEFLKNTHVWVCTTCGFVYVGDQAPALCPVCKVPDWKFEKIGGQLL